MKVSIIMGSDSDFEKMKSAYDFLKNNNIDVEVRAYSAHRTPSELFDYLNQIEDTDVIIAAAGKAAHLPGVIASKTIKPVIGVPILGSSTQGMDSLLSIVQMPPGIPVATVAIDGALNSAILALQIMALKYDRAKEILKTHREDMRKKVIKSNENLQTRL